MSVLNNEQRSRIMEEAINELDVITESDWFKDLVEEKVRKVLEEQFPFLSTPSDNEEVH
jgi:predicted transcriptional regulator